MNRLPVRASYALILSVALCLPPTSAAPVPKSTIKVRALPDHFHLEALGELLSGRKAELAGARTSELCATSDALDRYLEGRYRMQLRLRDRQGAGGGEASATAAAATGGVRMRDGIWILDSDDTVLANDDPQDLVGQSLRFTPSAGGYDVTIEPLQYDAAVGTEVLSGASSRQYLGAGLANFAFPIGGSAYSTLFIGSDLAVRTQTPSGVPVFAGDEYTVTQAGADLFTDPVDRLSPLFFARGDNWGRYIYWNDTPQKVLITWRTNLSPALETFYVDVQAALFPDGSILYSYQTLQNVDSGAALVYAGIQSWINGLVSLGTSSDPVEGATSVDVVSLDVEEDSATDMIHARATMADAIPFNSNEEIGYWLTLSQGGNPVYRYFTWINNNGRGMLFVFSEAAQAWYREGRPNFDGASWDVFFSLSELPDLAPGTIDVTIETELDDLPVDDTTLVTTFSGGPRFERDYTAEQPFSSSLPLVEAYHYPEFLPRGAKDKFFAFTGWDETTVDGVPMYQSFYTALILWAGGYYTYGNCAAANIGLCDPTEPLRPGLMHMNKPYVGFNQPTSPDRFTVLGHEFGHRWLQLVDIDEGAGASDVLNPISAHPAAYVRADAAQPLVHPQDTSVMGGGYWRNNGNGTFSTPSFNTYYSYAPYELYLMGLMDPADVTNWFYLENPVPPQPLAYWPSPATTVSGTQRTVTIQMLLDAMGPRVPAYPQDRTDFFTPLMLVVRPGEEPSTQDWDFMMSLRDPWRSSFFTQTDGRGTVATISPREVSPPGLTPLRVEEIGTDLRLFFEDPGFSDQVTYNVYEGSAGGAFDDWSPLACDQIASDAGGGELFIDATPLLPAQSSYYLVTMSNVALEGSPGAGSDGAERTTAATPCGAQ